jgi:XTP/dITP diphosphohydrolase
MAILHMVESTLRSSPQREGSVKLVIATKNKDKIREIAEKFSSLSTIQIISLLDYDDAPEIIENGITFKENACKKAMTISAYAKLPALADDSGLEIDALNGEPGIYSARYAGENKTDEERNQLILQKMEGVPEQKRTARFRCVIALVVNNTVYTNEGICEGRISFSMRGDNGFGYDPIFFIPQLNKTMAELPLSQKNEISHRAKALDKTRELLEKLYDES